LRHAVAARSVRTETLRRSHGPVPRVSPEAAASDQPALASAARTRQDFPSGMARLRVWLCLVPLTLVGTGGAVWISSLRLPEGAPAPGVSIAGVHIEAGAAPPVAATSHVTPGAVDAAGAREGAALEALVAELARRVEALPVRLVVAPGGSEVPPTTPETLGGLGIVVDREATLRRARAIGRRGSPLSRWRELSAAQHAGVDVPLELIHERHVTFERLAALKEQWDRPPSAARYPSSPPALVPHVPGRYLDLERAADTLWLLARAQAPASLASSLELPLSFVTIVPRVNAQALGQFRPSHVVSEYSTRFRVQGDQATRAANIAVAASRLDGVILLPGDRLSFNDVVGERSVDNGFFDSWEILEGEFVRGVGGGTCQVSSTLNAAALRAGLKIVEAYTHSRPLAYIEKGLDATVAWPFVDLKLQNSWPVPVAIQAVVKGNAITVRVLTESSPGRVAIRSEVKDTIPFPRVVEVGRAPRGSFKRKQEGIPGFRIQRTRFIWPEEGAARREVVFKRYRPTPELFVVAPDFDQAELPPLPEGAEGYEPELDPSADPPVDEHDPIRLEQGANPPRGGGSFG
jgi:vancomycin resistance protein YoaR